MPDRARNRKIFVMGRGIGPGMKGPDIRPWEMAKVLASRHDVTMSARVPREEWRDGVRLIPSGRRLVLREAARHDVLIAQGVPPYLLVALAGGPTLLVSDLYYSAERDLASSSNLPKAAKQLALAPEDRRLQLRFADLLLCAGQRQREDLLSGLEQLGAQRREPPPVEVVPFGIPEPPPASTRRPIRERLPAIADDDPVVLWWGQIWPWFDADAAIHAFATLLRRGRSAKLLFASGHATGLAEAPTKRARSLAASLDLLDKEVFFLDDWVPYEERQHYLQEADVGLTLHKHASEATLAARSRYMDYLWGTLPCVVGRGDELGERFEESGFGRAVEPSATDEVADALEGLLADDAARERARQAGRRLAASYQWPAAVQPLLDSLDELVERERSPAARAEVLYEARAYFAQRLRPAALPRSSKREPTRARS